MTVHPAVEVAIAGLDVTVMACDPELADTAAFCAHYGVPLERSANTILIEAKRPAGGYAVCVALASTRLDVNGTVRRRMEVRKASFASAETTQELTGMEIGGVTPFGLPPELPIYVDAAVIEAGRVVVGGGDRSSKLEVPAELLAALPSATVVEGLAR